ncbi:nucleotidyltransferase domain-containing protein [Vibrio sp. SG41-7]|uniref:type VII toxin-antitoxin system MntA family adenylyltransferase antitoxin n=1 Tax=Vibrio sp. SG41-7 TaxID=2760973 RepID=UPI001603CA90|nr:nucleotidyltransferase domain-containing protein [Vibrio sp. SG41-7]MBB1465193.1 nucleotidyltransferase domain-containing protein [Vibrio sp. SG41-7]
MIDSIVSLAEMDESIELVWLYGSRAQGTHHQESDFDLAVAFHDHALSVLALRTRPECLAIEWAEQLDLPLDKLSIVDINRLPVALAFNVIEYGVLIYNNNPLLVYKEQNRIHSMFEYQLIEAKRNALHE